MDQLEDKTFYQPLDRSLVGKSKCKNQRCLCKVVGNLRCYQDSHWCRYMIFYQCRFHILQDRDTVLHRRQLDNCVRNLLQDMDLPRHLRQDRPKG